MTNPTPKRSRRLRIRDAWADVPTEHLVKLARNGRAPVGESFAAARELRERGIKLADALRGRA